MLPPNVHEAIHLSNGVSVVSVIEFNDDGDLVYRIRCINKNDGSEIDSFEFTDPATYRSYMDEVLSAFVNEDK